MLSSYLFFRSSFFSFLSFFLSFLSFLSFFRFFLSFLSFFSFFSFFLFFSFFRFCWSKRVLSGLWAYVCLCVWRLPFPLPSFVRVMSVCAAGDYAFPLTRVGCAAASHRSTPHLFHCQWRDSEGSGSSSVCSPHTHAHTHTHARTHTHTHTRNAQHALNS